MSSTSQLISPAPKPIRALGSIAFVLAVVHGWMFAMHWKYGIVSLRTLEVAVAGILLPFLIAYAITSRRMVRDWNRVGLWFLLSSLVALPAIAHGLHMLGVLPR
jgi:hypothetical protein